jgi:hypothetical protein
MIYFGRSNIDVITSLIPEEYMLKTLFAAVASAALILAVQAQGVEAIPLNNLQGATAPDVTLVYGGCGVFGHRGPYGGCRAGGQAGGYRAGRPCPPGFHLGPRGAKCWPN